MDARIIAVSTSQKKGEKKINISEGTLVPDHGLTDDAHAGPWHRQVSLLGTESIAKIQAKGIDVGSGDFAENITTEGIRLWELPIGTEMQLGNDARVAVTQIGKTCHDRCAIFHQVGDCVMPREGIFVKVLQGGTIKPGDAIELLSDPPAQDAR